MDIDFSRLRDPVYARVVGEKLLSQRRIEDKILNYGGYIGHVNDNMQKEAYEQIIEAEDLDYSEVITAIKNGVPFQEICDRENSEIKNEVKDLSKRVETLENQIKEDKEEQLKSLKAELKRLIKDIPLIWDFDDDFSLNFVMILFKL